MTAAKTLRDVLGEEIRGLYSAEIQWAKALPDLARAATNSGLKATFLGHFKEGEGQVRRLDKVVKILGISLRDVVCGAVRGVVEESAERIADFPPGSARDAVLISTAQRVEHYEISAYRSARTFAKLLGSNEVAGLLQGNLEEEIEADRKLTDLAEHINPLALSAQE